jgi:patatin-related protein
MPMLEEPREALRLALVMNGGVSLAVWMGGVTQEIFLLTQASRALDRKAGPAGSAVYRGLLELTRSEAMVDVISGTSAGGVNGAALAVALLHDGDFSLLREVWRETGALQSLLRPPLGANPGSLLQGDDYFLPQIRAALQKLARRARPRTVGEQPLELRLSTTLLTGHQGGHQDDLGTPLHDVDYRAQFVFRHLNEAPSPAELAHWLDALARAARSTASFPFAFEPSPVSAEMADAYLRTAHGEKVRPGDRHVIDGGVLNNKPFQGALESIFNIPRTGPTRRVLAYINPDPGDGPEGQTGQAMPSLGEVLLDALFGIPQSQTVADHLREIRQHNDKVRRQRDSLLQVVNALSGDQLAEQARTLYKVYRQRRLVNTYGLFIEPRLNQAVSALGRHTLNQLKALFCDPDQAHDWLPIDWGATEAEVVGGAGQWQWGLFPVEFAASVMLNALKLAESLAGLPSPHDAAASALRLTQLHGLRALWPRVNALIAEVKQKRVDEAGVWRGYERALRQAWLHAQPQGDGGPPRLDALSLAMVKALSFLSSSERQVWCKTQMDTMAQVLTDLAPLAIWAARHASAAKAVDKLRQRQAEGLKQLASLFHLQSKDHIVHRLLQLEVVCYAFDDHESLDQDTLIELVQVSGNLRSPLVQPVIAPQPAPPAPPPRAKLRGLELAHFGAFYKSSWRANDWIHGRLDGADRLVHTLLNPERLRVLYLNRAETVEQAIRVLSLEGSPEEQKLLRTLWAEHDSQAQVHLELRFLDDPHLPMPDTLPHSAAAVLRRLHLQALRDELPGLIEAIAQDKDLGAEPGVNAAGLSRLPPGVDQVHPDDALQALRQGLINDEHLLEQAGSDLFTRTVAHVTASVQNTMASASARLGPISWFFALLKLPVQGFNLVAQGLTRQNPTAAAFHGGLLAVGLVLTLLSFKLDSVASAGSAAGGGSWLNTVVDFGWLLLLWGTLFTVVRSPRTAVLLLATTGAVLGIGLLFSNPVLGLGLMAATAALITVAVLLPRRPGLQWALGLLAIPLFATLSIHPPLWERGWVLSTPEWCALGVVGVLLVAVWQASPHSIRLERWMRTVLKRRQGD